MEILKEGHQVYAEQGWGYAVGENSDWNYDEPNIAVGTDITGDGIPDLVVKAWSKRLAPIRYMVFQIGDSCKKIADIETDIGGEFRDLDGDGIWEFITYDCSFDCLGAWSRQASPKPRVILSYDVRREKYSVSPQWMRGESLDDKGIADLSESLRNDTNVWLDPLGPHRFYQVILDCLYSGREQEGWAVYDLAWPDRVPGKEAARARLREALGRSRYWAAGSGL